MSNEDPALRLGDIFAANCPGEPEVCYRLARNLLGRGPRYILEVLVDVGVVTVAALDGYYNGGQEEDGYRVVPPVATEEASG